MATRKRGQYEGSIYKRKDGRWVGVFSTGDGRRVARYGRTRPEAVQKMADAQRAHQDGMLPRDGRLTVEGFSRQWLDGVRISNGEKTAETYEWAIDKHIVPRMGRLRLSDVQPRHLESVYREMAQDGKAPATVRKVHVAVGTMFEKAHRLGLIPRNPVRLAETPKVPKREPQMLDRAELRKFITAAGNSRLEALFILAVTSGARSGELLGLRWSDVETEASQIHIRGALHLTRSGLSLAETKTPGSVRTLALSHVAIDGLHRHMTRQNEEALRLGPAWGNEWGLVFVNEVGDPLDRRNVLRRHLRPLLKHAGLPPLTFHDLRHVAGSLALDQGVPLTVVSRALGHTDLTTTARIYMHQIKGSERKVAAAFDEMLTGS